MKVLGINGSPRKNGNTETLLDKVLEGAKSKGAKVEKVNLRDLKISPCIEAEYEKVKPDGTSIVEDDWHLVYNKIQEADAVILASPIFFGSLSAQMKAFIDRFQCVWVSKFMLNKDLFDRDRLGGFIAAEATDRKDFFENAGHIVKNLFATIRIDYAGEVLCHSVDKKDSALGREDCLNSAFSLGEKLAS